MDAGDRDPELLGLLAIELERHLRVLEQTRDLDEARRSAHALKGSSALAGEPELADELAALEKRLRAGDAPARGEAVEVVRDALARLAGSGRASRPAPAWPTPPPSLRPSAPRADLADEYRGEVRERLARLDELVAERAPEVETLREAFRHVHTVKGAASAVGDEPVAWFCHGLEARLESALRGAPSPAEVRAALGELATHLGTLGALLEDAEAQLALLRVRAGGAATRAPARTSAPPADARRSTTPSEDLSARVPLVAIERAVAELDAIEGAGGGLSGDARRALLEARLLRRLRGDLAEALRLIGPARPWGAPQAALSRVRRVVDELAALGDAMEHAADGARGRDVALREGVRRVRGELGRMREQPIRTLFQKLEAGLFAEARRSGKQVRVDARGGDETVSRTVLERLSGPLLQIARNAVAHGIETPEQRRRSGKPEEAVVVLEATKKQGRLVVRVADDGAGVDVAKLRRKAVLTGLATTEDASSLDDDTLLGLLFLPGLSLRDDADWLAGRGVGLDAALVAVQRSGGTLRLASRHGAGFEASVAVPAEFGPTRLLALRVAGHETVVLASRVVAVAPADPEALARVLPLAAVLGLRSARAPRYVLSLDTGLDAEEVARVAVDEVLGVEIGTVRALDPILSRAGPFVGAVARGDGTVRFVLDAVSVGPRAKAFERTGDPRDAGSSSRMLAGEGGARGRA